VRVEVADQHGFELGRNFVEIATAQRGGRSSKPSAPERSAAARPSQGS
jgi:hypothetical protein